MNQHGSWQHGPSLSAPRQLSDKHATLQARPDCPVHGAPNLPAACRCLHPPHTPRLSLTQQVLKEAAPAAAAADAAGAALSHLHPDVAGAGQRQLAAVTTAGMPSDQPRRCSHGLCCHTVGRCSCWLRVVQHLCNCWDCCWCWAGAIAVCCCCPAW